MVWVLVRLLFFFKVHLIVKFDIVRKLIPFSTILYRLYSLHDLVYSTHTHTHTDVGAHGVGIHVHRHKLHAYTHNTHQHTHTTKSTNATDTSRLATWHHMYFVISHVIAGICWHLHGTRLCLFPKCCCAKNLLAVGRLLEMGCSSLLSTMTLDEPLWKKTKQVHDILKTVPSMEMCTHIHTYAHTCMHTHTSCMCSLEYLVTFVDCNFSAFVLPADSAMVTSN